MNSRPHARQRSNIRTESRLRTSSASSAAVIRSAENCSIQSCLSGFSGGFSKVARDHLSPAIIQPVTNTPMPKLVFSSTWPIATTKMRMAVKISHKKPKIMRGSFMLDCPTSSPVNRFDFGPKEPRRNAGLFPALADLRDLLSSLGFPLCCDSTF